ncbi:MAG: hypothetical protein ACRC8Y_01380 [Chroococcales cyanobacterium]
MSKETRFLTHLATLVIKNLKAQISTARFFNKAGLLILGQSWDEGDRTESRRVKRPRYQYDKKLAKLKN